MISTLISLLTWIRNQSYKSVAKAGAVGGIDSPLVQSVEHWTYNLMTRVNLSSTGADYIL